MFALSNSEILTPISWICEQITGMLVLICMYFSWWLQIWQWNSTILTFVTKFVTYFTCRLHSPAAWKALSIMSAAVWGMCYTMCFGNMLVKWCYGDTKRYDIILLIKGLLMEPLFCYFLLLLSSEDSNHFPCIAEI